MSDENKQNPLRKWWWVWLIVVILLIGLCNDPNSESSTPVSGTEQDGQSGRLVTQNEFGDRWPFTVESGYVDCIQNKTPVFRSGPKTYGLTGYGTTNLGLPEIDPIWKNNPSIAGVKISLTPITDLARQQCE